MVERLYGLFLLILTIQLPHLAPQPTTTSFSDHTLFVAWLYLLLVKAGLKRQVMAGDT